MGFRTRQLAVLAFAAVMVAVVTGLVSGILLVRVHVLDARERADVVGRTYYHLIRHVILASSSGDARQTISTDPFLRSYSEAVVGYSPTTLFVAIRDEDGVAILHSDPNQEGRTLAPAETLAEFSDRSALSQIRALSRGNRVLVADVPFSADGVTQLGSVVVAVSSLFLRNRLLGAVATHALIAAGVTLLAFLGSFFIANRLLAPIERLRAELARLDPEGRPRLDLRTNADVGRLIEYFATMSDTVARSAGEGGDRAWTRTMLDGLSDAVLVVSSERRVLTANEGARRLIGRPRAEIDGASLDTLLAAGHPLHEMIDEALGRAEAVPPRTATLTSEGQDAVHVLSARVLRDGDRVRGVLVTARNVQTLSALASQLSTSRQLAALGRLTSGVAHEIRNPLNALVMQTALLRSKLPDVPEAARHHLDVLDEEVHKLDRVVESFLKFTRPEELRLETVRLDEVIGQALVLTSPRAQKVGIRLEPSVNPAIPAVHGSPELLRQALLNLFVNACDAMPDGGTLRVRAEPSHEGRVVITVEDTGIGIPADELPRVFHLYHTTKSHGSGIGLSLVYRIVQLHGGEIRVESAPGQGTRFTLTLPEDPV